MSRENVIVGIDVGSANIRTVIVQTISDSDLPRVIGVGISPSSGIRKGVVVDPGETTRAIIDSIEKSEGMAGITVKNAAISISGSEISFQNSKGVVAVGRADGEVTEDDIERVMKESQNIAIPLNREILHLIPRSFRLDDQENIKDPLGMKGVRLEADVLIIEGSSNQTRNLKKSVEQSGVEVEDFVLEPLACAKAVLDKKQRELGAVVVNIGGNTTSLAIFEEEDLIHTSVIPVGANHVTNDVAIGLRTSIDIAEKVKLEYGSAIARDISKKDEIDLSQVDSQETGIVSRHHVAEIIQARMEEIFQLVNKELKKVGRAEMLPAGAILTGGGSKLPQIVELAKETLRLPVQIGYPIKFGGMTDKIDDPGFSTVIGLIVWEKEKRELFSGTGMLKNISQGTGETVKKVRRWVEKFLP